jgi:hypothetical protein
VRSVCTSGAVASREPFAAAQLRNALLGVQDDSDLLFGRKSSTRAALNLPHDLLAACSLCPSFPPRVRARSLPSLRATVVQIHLNPNSAPNVWRHLAARGGLPDPKSIVRRGFFIRPLKLDRDWVSSADTPSQAVSATSCPQAPLRVGEGRVLPPNAWSRRG